MKKLNKQVMLCLVATLLLGTVSGCGTVEHSTDETQTSVNQEVETLEDGSKNETEENLKIARNTLDKGIMEIRLGKLTGTITFSDKPISSSGEVVNINGDCTVLATLDPNGTDAVVYAKDGGKVFAPADSSKLFDGYSAQNFDFSGLDTSQVVDMNFLLANTKISSIDLSTFDTSKVTDMSGMFFNTHIDSLDLSTFDTSKVKNMEFMFSSCKVPTLDLRNFNTSQVTNMHAMFFDSTISTVDLSSFDTSQVCEMGGMFMGSGFTTLDLNSFTFDGIKDYWSNLITNDLSRLGLEDELGIHYNDYLRYYANGFFGRNVTEVYVRTAESYKVLEKVIKMQENIEDNQITLNLTVPPM